nr:putative reverse transcriptase domain-containing protein [Tanacetum cinerariifolium]
MCLTSPRKSSKKTLRRSLRKSLRRIPKKILKRILKRRYRALEMPPTGSSYEVGGPSSQCRIFGAMSEKKRQAEMEANSFEIRKVKKCMNEFGRDLGDEVRFSNLVENRVTRIMPPKMMKRKAIKKIVKKRIAEAIEEYEKTRANPGKGVWINKYKRNGLVNANRIPRTEFKSMMNTKYCPATEIQRMEEGLWTLTFKGDDIEAYNNRFHELALMCPNLVPNEKKKIERKNTRKITPTTITPTTVTATTTTTTTINTTHRTGDRSGMVYAATPAEGRVTMGIYHFAIGARHTIYKADEKKLDDICIVHDFPKVFPDDLTGLPLVREIEFRIDLIPGAFLVVNSPYRLAPFEMLELSNQLKELQ